jgi:hypothetical protein
MAGRSIQQEARIESLPAIRCRNTSIPGKLRASVFISLSIQDRGPAHIETVPYAAGSKLPENRRAHWADWTFAAKQRVCGCGMQRLQ